LGSGAVPAYDAWRKHFNGEGVVGRSITLNRTTFTITGVAGEGFHGPLILKADLSIPSIMQPITRAGAPLVDDPNAAGIRMMGRPKPGHRDDPPVADRASAARPDSRAGSLALSQITVRTLLALLPPLEDHQVDVSADRRIAAWTLLVAPAAGVVFGLGAGDGVTRRLAVFS
jgi:hypothetical protein